MTLRSLQASAALLLLLIFPAAAEKPKVAVIDAQRAFNEYYATKTAHKKLAQAKINLQNDKRLPVIAATEKELRDLHNKVRDTTLTEEQRQQFFKQSEMKAHELRALQRDTQQFMESEQQKMNKLLVSVTRKLQANVQVVIDQVAETEKFDIVFEKNGNSSSQVPTLLYARHAIDITDTVIKRLNSTDPNPVPEDDPTRVQPPPPAPTPPAPTPPTG
jgi:outer membrane protein